MQFGFTCGFSSSSAKWTLILVFVVLMITTVLVVLISGPPDHYRLEHDEFLTLDRSRSIAERGLWLSPETNHVPLLTKKPPLQYWITALFMKMGIPDIFSMHLVSILFFSGLLCFMLLLCESLRPGDFKLKLMTLVLSLSSPAFVGLAVTGLLDTGHGFFLMVTVSSIYLSRRDSKWWYLACLGWSLGFLQKSPIALFVAVCLMIGLSFTIKQDGFKFSELRRDRHFLWSWMVGAFICTAYIGLKLYQYGYESIKEAFVHQIIHRFIPAMPNDPERHRGWGFIFYHLIQDGIVYWTLSFLALITFIFLKRKLLSGKEWLILCYIALVFSVFVLSGGIIYFRYMTVLIPFIVIFVSIAITDVFRSSGKVQWILAGIMFVSSFPVYQREWRE